MTETPITFKNRQWAALQEIKETLPGGPSNEFFPVYLLSVSPRKSGQGILDIELMKESGKETVALKVLSRSEILIGTWINDPGRIAIFSEISWAWLRKNCPKHFIDQDKENLQTDDDLIFFLDRLFAGQIYHKEFLSFRGSTIQFRFETKYGYRLVGKNVPITINGENFLDLYDEAANRVKFYMPEINLEKAAIQVEPVLDEDEVLINCALRFDGYKYAEIFNKKAEATEIPADPLDQLHMFFMLQRYLYKWGGEQEPRNGKVFKTFRELFLLVYRRSIPVEFIRRDYYRKWVENYQPFIDQAGEVVRRSHESTVYV